MDKRDEDEIEENLSLYRTPGENLILELGRMLKKPTIEAELSAVLERFLQKLKDSEKYLENRIFNVNFAEASLVLQSSCVLYGKKVDLLWEKVLEILKRFSSYNKTSGSQNDEEKEEENKLFERINRYKRKKLQKQQENTVTQSAVSQLDSLLKNAEHVQSLPHIVGSACKTLENLWSEASKSSLKLKRLRAKVAPLIYTYIRKTAIYSQTTGEKLCNYNELFLNRYNSGQVLNEDKCMQMYNLRHLIDDILQSYLAEHEITFTKMSECNLWPDFKHYLEENIVVRLKALIKLQREQDNGGMKRSKPLVLQEPPVDLSMLSVFGNYEVSYNPEDDSDDDETVILELDDSGIITSTPVTQTKSSASRRVSEMYSEADSAFHEGTFMDDDENDINEEDTVNNSSSKENGQTDSNNVNQELEKEKSSEEVASKELNDSGYFEGNCLNGDECEYPLRNSLSSEGIDVGNDLEMCGLEDEENNTEIIQLDQSEKTKEGDNVSKEQIETIQGFGLYEEPEDPLNQEMEENNNLLNGVDGNVVKESCPKVPACFQKNEGKMKNGKEMFEVESLKRSKSIVKVKESKKRKRNDVADCKELPKSKHAKSEGTRKISVQVIAITSLRKQEKFFVENYNPDENEGGISPQVYEESASSESSYENSFLCDRWESDFETENQSEWLQNLSGIVMLDHSYYKQLPSSLPKNLETSTSECTEMASTLLPDIQNPVRETEAGSPTVSTIPNASESVEALDHNDNDDENDRTSSIILCNDDEVNKEISPTENTDTFQNEIFLQKLRELEKRQSVLNEWKSFILPKLAAAEGAPVFDIHEYGSRIMDAIPQHGIAKFDDLVMEKSTAEVARYFLAALQLANTNNIEFHNVSQGELVNDKLDIKLITKERYHEHLEGFVAPSEESFHERLKRARKDAFSPTSRGCSSSKRRKV